MENCSHDSRQILEGDGKDELGFDANNLDVRSTAFEFGDSELEMESDRLDIGAENHEVECGREELEDDHCELDSDLLESEGNGNGESCDQMLSVKYHGHQINGNRFHKTTALTGQNGEVRGVGNFSPVVGMIFDSYEEAYNHYNSYAKDTGFAIRVKSSWTKRNSKEKRGAVLCCNCEGFKTIKETSTRRKETRTGCLAMVRLRLVNSSRWKVDEVQLEHNHSFDYQRFNNSKILKKIDNRSKRKAEPAGKAQVKTIKLYRTDVADQCSYGISNEMDNNPGADSSKGLNLTKGEIKVIHDYVSRAQQSSPNFFYLMDLSDEGFLRNVFWVYQRFKVAYQYFGDVLILESKCLSAEYDVQLFSFTGVNHHGQVILFGSGLLLDESFETFVWLFRAFLSCMSGTPPQTIISDSCKPMLDAISEVFPRARLRINPSCFIQASMAIAREEMIDLDTFEIILSNIVYESMTVDGFERGWEDMMCRFGIADNQSLQKIYEVREQWAPVYSKGTFFAGSKLFWKGGFVNSFFNGSLHGNTPVKNFLDLYDIALQKMRIDEDLKDLESCRSNPVLATSNCYELQLVKVFTNSIFRKFQDEVRRMSSCFSITRVHINGSVVTYAIKERQEQENVSVLKTLEVTYDKTTAEIRCICNVFYFEGYLCRHALCILNYHGVEKIPNQYILARWRKDVCRAYANDCRSNAVDIYNPVQRFDHLHRRAMLVVEEGMTSLDRYLVACQAFKDSLREIRLVPNKHANQF